MVSIRVFCYLLIFFVLQLHAKVSNANSNCQVLQTENSEDPGATTSTQITNKLAEDVFENRKTSKRINVKVEADEKNGFEIESKETVRKRNNKKKKRLTQTASLTADYSNPGHHPPRHN